MSKDIYIVGGLPEAVDFRSVVAELNSQTASHDITWAWIYCDAAGSFAPPDRLFKQLLELIRQSRRRVAVPSRELVVAKLGYLNGKAENQLYREEYSDPVNVPREVVDGCSLIAWLLSPEANLVPHLVWNATLTEAAIIALLVKLVRHKRWNKDTQGHQWTVEEDLLGQAPVMRSDYQPIAVEARAIVERLRGTLLIRKGSGQGNTPREWSINIAHLSAVKKSILIQSLAPLGAIAGLESLIQTASQGERIYRLDEGVVSERVRQICREAH
jgi:hypothetical protein